MDIFFDRGTIVAEATGGGLDPDPLPEYFLWDRRVGQWRAPADRLAAFRGWLKARRIAFTYRSPRPEGFAPIPVPRDRLPALRPYQEEAIEAWTAAGCRGLVELPTGSGKTRLAIRAILSLGRPAIVLVPTRQLLGQWRSAIGESYPGPVGAYGDGEHDLEPITVSTYESAHLHLDRIGDHFDLLIVDEAHHLLSPEVSESARMATAPLRLGLSATFPSRRDWRDRAADLLGPPCFALPLSRISGSYLADFDLKIVPLRLTPGEQAEHDVLRGKFLLHFRPFIRACPDAGWSDFVRACGRSPGGREALAAFRKSREMLALSRAKLLALDGLLDIHREDRKLIFAADNRSAYEISRRFLVPAITCEIGRRERDVILARFREGAYRAIVSAKVLNEGLDVPSASAAIILGGSSSPLEQAQRIGRVLRPMAGKRAVVYELVHAGTGEWRESERRGRHVLDAAPPV